MRWIGLVTVLCVMLAEPSTTFAQSNASDAALDGFVKDPSGAVVAGARVIAINLGTSQVHETASAREGYFRFPLLQIGEYQLVVSASGFADYQQSGIRPVMRP